MKYSFLFILLYLFVFYICLFIGGGGICAMAEDRLQSWFPLLTTGVPGIKLRMSSVLAAGIFTHSAPQGSALF